MNTRITDPIGRSITLHDRTWFGHIVKGHPDIAAHRDLVEPAIANPNQIRLSNAGPEGRLYFGTGPRVGIMVVVVVDVELALVKTAHLARKPSGGAVEWPS